MAEVKRPGQVVLHFHWEQAGLQCQETYGPWAVADDGISHMAEVRDFIAGWHRLTGLRATAVIIALVTDPAGWVRERQERAEADWEYVRRGMVPAEEMREKGSDDG